MNVKESKQEQINRLQETCLERGIDYKNLEVLLDSVKTKKLFKRNNYHMQAINTIIEKSI